MSPEPQRKLSSSAGVAPAAAPSYRPATCTPPGAWRGAGYGQPFGATERTDTWWLMPLAQALGLGLLGLYATWAAFQGAHYEFGNYLSPFYSPLLKPAWWPISPAFLILWIPAGFRGTCYYYRKAYYRAFFADPSACAVGEPRKGYRGEVGFPWAIQNLHRYFMYFASILLVFLWWDVIRAFIFTDPDGSHYLAIGGGTLAILASNALLTMYSLSCHSLRHLVGGKLDCFSCAVAGGPRHGAWSRLSALNAHHMGYAWWSLFAVCFADFYVRMCSMGVFHDPMFVTFRHLFDYAPKISHFLL